MDSREFQILSDFLAGQPAEVSGRAQEPLTPEFADTLTRLARGELEPAETARLLPLLERAPEALAYLAEQIRRGRPGALPDDEDVR